MGGSNRWYLTAFDASLLDLAELARTIDWRRNANQPHPVDTGPTNWPTIWELSFSVVLANEARKFLNRTGDVELTSQIVQAGANNEEGRDCLPRNTVHISAGELCDDRGESNRYADHKERQDAPAAPKNPCG